MKILDWEKFEKKFYKECTSQTTIGMGSTVKVTVLYMTPQQQLTWFKKQFGVKE